MSDRGFLHDVKTKDDVASVTRIPEQDGIEAYDNGPEARVIGLLPVSLVPGYFEDDYDGDDPNTYGYFETDSDLPDWLMDWALTIINAADETADEAAWIAPKEPVIETQDIVADEVRPGDTIVGLHFNETGWMDVHHQVASIRRHTSSRGFLSGVPMINFHTEGGHTVRSDRSRVVRVIRPARGA